MRFRLKSAAKVNLTLDILGRRADGYHELASVVHTVGIWDELELDIHDGGEISFTCNRTELAGDENLCVRAVQTWNKATGANFGARIHLQKRIPTGAGLGGGSGNAAAMLLALNRASASPLSGAQLHEIGATLGADVPLFLEGGAVLMEGIGEKLTPLEPLAGYLFVIKPEASFATPSIYRAWDASGFRSQNATPQLLEIWNRGDLSEIAGRMGNDLERATAQFSDLPARLIHLLRQCEPLGAQMSGSGSACFSVYEEPFQVHEICKALETALAKDVQLRSSQLFVAPFCERGVEFLD
ncbi:MAG: 4-(cytidine 5'-diphospho)-2-C-methyl-D-erythritol kinase [Armatimonadetes bacterium]|nr:4-(cytidine 5'-diphospho)-2-C-methyl-D-erythritol kinase [Armatimonadota bacterium]